jgi:hypothetical protein
MRRFSLPPVKLPPVTLPLVTLPLVTLPLVTLSRVSLSRVSLSQAAGCLFVVCLLVVVACGEAIGCPNCKDGVNTSDPEGLNLARGYFYSILLMLAMPFTLAGTFGCYVWREMRRQQREQAAASGPGPVES